MFSNSLKSALVQNIGNLVSKSTTRLSSGGVQKLVYSEYGDPETVVRKESEEIRDPGSGEVQVKMLAAPVHPADINLIQGKYSYRSPLPAVAGGEGVGRVLKVGSGVTKLTEGDHVIPAVYDLGTWRTHLTVPHEKLLKVSRKLDIVEAANLTVNPHAAYRMLKDFVDLKPGDVVIQNGANSACGQNIIEICRAWGYKTVNIVRDRPDLQQLKDFLASLGADYIFTEGELKTTDIFKSGQLPKPKLALNCVGGKSASAILRHLQNGSPMVTYGGMSLEPVTLPTPALIFQDIRACGYLNTLWVKNNSLEKRMAMLEELVAMMLNKQLRGPVSEMINYEDYKEAFRNTISAKGMVGKKYILDFGSE